MVLIPWRCYEDLSCFTQEMNQLFDRFFGGELIDRPWEKLSYPPLTITETENQFQVYLEIKGFSPEDLEITFKEDTLIINGEKKKKEELKAEGIYYSEGHIRSFRRTIKFQKKVKVDAIVAKYKDGILTILLPKVEEKKFLVTVE